MPSLKILSQPDKKAMMNFRNSNNRNSSALNNIRNKNGRRPLGNDVGPMINAGQGGGFGILGHAPSMPTGMGGGGGMNNMGGGGMNNMGGGGMNNMGGGGGSGGMNNMVGGGRGGGMNNNMANMNSMGNFGGMMPQQATNMGMGGMVGMGSGMMMQQHQQQQQQQQHHHQQQHHQQQHHQQQHQRQNLGVQQQQAMRETQLALVNTLLKGSMMGSGGRNRNPQGGGSAAAAAAAAAAAGMGFGMLGSHGQLPSLLDIKTSGLKRRAGSESMSGGVKKMKKDNTERSSRGKERIIRPNDRRRPQGGNPTTTTTTTTTKKRDPQYSQGRKDQSSNRRQRDTSAKKKLEEEDDDDDEEEDDDEMYDPAEPTDDEIQSTEHSNGGLTVTIDGNKRSVTEDGMRDSGSDSEKTDSSERKSQYFCHACMVECYNNKNFKNHMRGTKHRSRMDDLANLHQQKATQLFVRLKAEEHLRNIEKRGAEPMKKHYCSVCELNLSIPYNKHRQTREHQLRVLEVYGNNKGSSNQQINDRKDWPRCSLCDQIFKSPRKYVHHLSSARHKERKGQKTEEYTEVPEYEENKAYGQNYIIPVSGYFCKLCHKFYNNENAAKNTHCQSKAHFEKFEKIIREKIEAKKNAEAGESESEVKEDETREFEEDEMEVNKDSRLEEEEENCEADDDDDDDDDDDEVYPMQSEDTMPTNMEEDLDKTLVPDEDEDGQNEDVDEESDHENEERKGEEEEDDEMLLADKNSSPTIIEKSTMDEASRENTEEEEDQPQKQQPEEEEEKQPQQQIVDKSEKQSSGSLSEGEEEKEKEQTSKGRNRSRGRGRGRGRGKK